MTFDPKAFVNQAPNKPGIYRMLDRNNKVIYVGKAKNLKKRLQSYFRSNLDSGKTQLLVSKLDRIEITVTNTENEALILENNLIKEYKPRYNILMRDDKSYPYIILSKHKLYPRLSSYRGVKKQNQRYFGPFPNVSAVKHSLELLQKLFHIRPCSDAYFNNRTRPCLQYQIKRCSAPCVGYITPENYSVDLQKAILFLRGKNKELIHQLVEQMQTAANQLQFERAAQLRDQIDKLEAIQEQQHVMQEKGSFDVVTVIKRLEQIAIGVLTVDDGRLLGSKTHILKSHQESVSDALSAFISQHYLLADNLPKAIIVNHQPDELCWLASALTESAGYKVDIILPQRGEKMRWLEMAEKNAEQALMTHLQQHLSQKKRWQALIDTLQWEKAPNRIECFDISHSQGEATVASCVVFDQDGPIKKLYRRYNINDITPGDDYAALHQAITRRYQRMLKDDKTLPDVVIIDGGKGQLQQAIDVFNKLEVKNIKLLSISKGPGRNPNYDIIWQENHKNALHLPADSIALHTVQQIRDEAHRFAITGHKNKRGKLRQHSILEDIEGIGAKRRQLLLKTFGGLQGLQQASVEQLAALDGISNALALKIYQHLH